MTTQWTNRIHTQLNNQTETMTVVQMFEYISFALNIELYQSVYKYMYVYGTLPKCL